MTCSVLFVWISFWFGVNRMLQKSSWIKSIWSLCLAAACLGCGSSQTEDPTKREGFVDTSDPSKVIGTMKQLEKPKSSTDLGGKRP
jgi:hypothetical protein